MHMQLISISKKSRRTIASIFAILAFQISCLAQDSLFITRHTPARSWEEALPIGNRMLGAKIYGGAEIDSILLVDNTLSSIPYCTGKEYGVPFAKLTISDDNEEKASFNKLSLNLNRSLLTEEHVLGNHIFSREFFASYPDRLIGIRIRCKNSSNGENARGINCVLNLNSAFAESSKTDESHISIKGHCNHDGQRTSFYTRMIVNSTDGKVRTYANSIKIKEASEITLYLINETETVSDEKTVSNIDNKISDEIDLQTERLKMKEYDKIRFFHISDYRNLLARFLPSRDISKDRYIDAIYRNYLFISWPIQK